MYPQLDDPRVARVHARLSRVPRWLWYVIFVLLLIPVIALGVAIITVGFLAIVVIASAIVMVSVILGIAYKVMHRRRLSDDGRRNVQIVVHSARVIDP